MSCVSTWAVCNKELITVLAVGPWLLWQAWRRRSGFPSGRPLAILIAVGLATELIGNMGVQWGYEIVGLAVMVPAYTGFILVSTTILGGILLGERVSARNLAAVGLLILAVVLLGRWRRTSRPDHDRQTAGKPLGDRCRHRRGRRRGNCLLAAGHCHPALRHRHDKLQRRGGHHHGDGRLDARAAELRPMPARQS